MAIVNKVDKKVLASRSDVVKYQILTYCFFNDIQVSQSDLDCLTELAFNEDMELTKFCELVYEKNIFKSAQSARNALTKAEKKELVSKTGKNKKTICLHKKMNVQSEGTILLDFKILGNESKESQTV